MATDKVVLDLEVNSDKAGKSLADLKKEFKDAQKELSKLTQGSKEYIAQLEKLGGIKDDIGDLNQEINAFNPEGKIKALGNVVGGLAGGFAAAQGAVALFGVENKDLEKTLVKVQAAMAFQQGIQGLVGLGDAFKVLGNVIKANPIFLIVSIIVAIGAAMFALKDKISFIGDAFDFLGKVIETVVQAIKDFTDWIGISSFAMDEYSDKMVSNAKKQGDAIIERYEREIALAQAAGENTVEMEIKKQKAIIKTSQLEAMLMIEAAKARGEWADGEEARITELIKIVGDASFQIQLINAKEKAAIKAENQKAYDESVKLKQQQLLDEISYQDKLFNEFLKASQREIDFKAQLAANKKSAQEEEDAIAADKIARNLALSNEQIAKEDANRQRKKDADKQAIDDSFAIAQASNDGMQSLSDLYFMVKTRNLQKGSAAELKAAKQQFKINKALAITSATIQGVQAVLAAYSSGSAIPVVGAVTGPLFAALAGITVAANIAKISRAKFNESGTADGGGGASVPSPSAPNIAPPTQGSTQLNSDGTIKSAQTTGTGTIKAIVVETDITKTQKKVGSIETNAKL